MYQFGEAAGKGLSLQSYKPECRGVTCSGMETLLREETSLTCHSNNEMWKTHASLAGSPTTRAKGATLTRRGKSHVSHTLEPVVILPPTPLHNSLSIETFISAKTPSKWQRLCCIKSPYMTFRTKSRSGGRFRSRSCKFQSQQACG